MARGANAIVSRVVIDPRQGLKSSYSKMTLALRTELRLIRTQLEK
jgi:hypothetical protein